MKKIFLLGVMLWFSLSGFAQTQLDQFEGMDQVKSVVVNQKMFDLMAKVKMDESDQEAAHYLALLKKLTQLKLYSTVDKATAAQMKTVFVQYAAASKLAELSKIVDNGKSISLYAKPRANPSSWSELLLLVEGVAPDETVLFSLTGEIDLNEVAFLGDRLKLPGKEAIKKVVLAQKK